MRQLLVVVIAAVTLVGCGSEDSAVSASPDSGTGEVPGRFTKDCQVFGCTDPAAKHALTGSNAICFWRDGHVRVALTLQNDYGARIKVSVTPRYTIANAGQHGTSLGSEGKVSLAPGERLRIVIDAGKPEGVEDGALIDECTPYLLDADVSDSTENDKVEIVP